MRVEELEKEVDSLKKMIEIREKREDSEGLRENLDKMRSEEVLLKASEGTDETRSSEIEKLLQENERLVNKFIVYTFTVRKTFNYMYLRSFSSRVRICALWIKKDQNW